MPRLIGYREPVITVDTKRTDISSEHPDLHSAIRAFAGEEALAFFDVDVAPYYGNAYVTSMHDAVGVDRDDPDKWNELNGTLRIYFYTGGAVWKPEHRRWYWVKRDRLFDVVRPGAELDAIKNGTPRTETSWK